MSGTLRTRRFFTGTSGLGLAAVVSYAADAGLTWFRYGERARGTAEEDDALLDRFMPVYEIAERHHVDVAAPAETTFLAAKQQDLNRATAVQTIFKARQLALGTAPDDRPRPRGIRRLSLPLVKKEAERRAATVPAAVAG